MRANPSLKKLRSGFRESLFSIPAKAEIAKELQQIAQSLLQNQQNFREDK